MYYFKYNYVDTHGVVGVNVLFSHLVSKLI